MVEKSSFPQIPSTVWWGVRGVLQRSPAATIDEKYLGVQLGVQEAAAKQYVSELKRVGLLSDDGRATSLAGKWRHDDTYWEAVQTIMERVYPAGLLQVAPPGEGDRQKVVSWFTREGLGSGTANNKAATYFLISSQTPSEAPSKSLQEKTKPQSSKLAAKGSQAAKHEVKSTQKEKDSEASRKDGPSLNINMQIHISADASSEQIESVFAAMRRYLYENPVS